MGFRWIRKETQWRSGSYPESSSLSTTHISRTPPSRRLCTRVVVSTKGVIRLEWDEDAEGPMIIVGRHTDGHYGLIAEICPSNETAHILDGYQFVGYALDPIRSVYMRKAS